jgi:two-component system sensor histidine kinase YesM
MKKIFSKIITIDDIKVKNKLILLYILSVLIPVVVTNFIFYYNINKSVKEQQTVFLRDTLQTIKLNVESRIEDCIRVTDIFYQDNKLSILLSNNYKNQNEYYSVYNSDLKYYINKYEKLYQQIYEMNIYASNPSITSGGGYYFIDDTIKNTNWYRNALSSNSDIFIDTYMDKSTYNNLEKKTVRYFSIIRKLDNLVYGGVINKIMKVDIDYNFMNEIINSEGIDTDILIINNDNDIIFSNNTDYSSFTHEFISFDTYKLKPNTIMQSEELSGALKGYKIIIVAPKALVMSKIKSSNIYLVILTLINLVFPSIIILLISRSFKNRLETLSDHMKNIKNDKFNLNLVEGRKGTDEIGQLIGEFNRMSIRMDELIKDVYEASIQQKNLEIAKKQAELNALQSQINPHFLFNTLETIRMRCLLKQEIETSNIIKNLSKMLRRALNWGNDLVTISEEIAFTEDFLKIQMYRFEDKLRYNIYVDDEVKTYKIPKLSIMTLVENACIHGIENIARIGTVEISVKNWMDKIKIIIKDDGIGMSEERVNSLVSYLKGKQKTEVNSSLQGVGIKNVYMRLEMFYGNEFSFFINSKEDEGTEIEVEIPYDIKRNDN